MSLFCKPQRDGGDNDITHLLGGYKSLMRDCVPSRSPTVTGCNLMRFPFFKTINCPLLENCCNNYLNLKSRSKMPAPRDCPYYRVLKAHCPACGNLPIHANNIGCSISGTPQSLALGKKKCSLSLSGPCFQQYSC